MVALALKVYAVLSTLIVFSSLYWSDESNTLGLVLFLVVFGGNLYWTSMSVDAFLQSCKGDESSNVLGFLSSFRILIFLLSIFGILVAFGWVPVLIGNSLVVCTLLGSALAFEYLDKKGDFNE